MSIASNDHPGYRQAFLDWLACALAGRNERAPTSARANSGNRVAALVASGHVLDFDDTYPPWLSHLSAPTAPAALVVGAAIAQQLTVLGAGGLQAAFGTDAKSLQVGMAASQGVEAAHMAGDGATASPHIDDGVLEDPATTAGEVPALVEGP